MNPVKNVVGCGMVYILAERRSEYQRRMCILLVLKEYWLRRVHWRPLRIGIFWDEERQKTFTATTIEQMPYNNNIFVCPLLELKEQASLARPHFANYTMQSRAQDSTYTFWITFSLWVLMFRSRCMAIQTQLRTLSQPHVDIVRLWGCQCWAAGRRWILDLFHNQ